MPRGLPALLVALATGIAVGLQRRRLSALLLDETWRWPSPKSLALIAGAAVFLIGGYLTAVDFMRHGDISVVAPFRYIVIIWAIIVGFIVWGEVPDWPMLSARRSSSRPASTPSAASATLRVFAKKRRRVKGC